MHIDSFLGIKNYGGYSMLTFAVQQKHNSIVEYLVKLGANVNEKSDVSLLP